MISLLGDDNTRVKPYKPRTVFNKLVFMQGEVYNLLFEKE